MQCASRMLCARFSHCGISYYKGNELALEETRNLLTQYQGGKAVLSKNDKTGIATICLNHPEKKNAISGQILLDLEKAVTDLETWEIGKGLILHGANNIFSSGGDLSMSKNTTSAEMGYAISCFVQEVTRRIHTLPLVSVAVIEGVALGGGAEIAVASCDWRIMTPKACIGFVHNRMGLIPGWGGGVALKHLVGSSVALDLLTSGRLVTATEAVNIGLANCVIDSSSDVLEQAQQWIQKRVLAPIEVLRATKALMFSDAASNEELELERRLQAPLWGGQAKLEALAKHIKHKK